MDHLDALHAESGGIDAQDPKTPSRHLYGTGSKEMTGIEAFSIHFDRIPFPTSLIVSQRALSSYQLLFRHLFFSKHVERRLVGIWLDHQMMKQFQSLRRAMGPTYCLRQRMLHFMQNFIYYMMFEVIEPNWLEMETSIRKGQSEGSPQTVDDVIRVHNKFLDVALAECLLTNRELVRTLTKLMRTCLLFSDQLKRFMEATKIVSTIRIRM
jgi:gamma-tubulin complex component 2